MDHQRQFCIDDARVDPAEGAWLLMGGVSRLEGIAVGDVKSEHRAAAEHGLKDFLEAKGVPGDADA